MQSKLFNERTKTLGEHTALGRAWQLLGIESLFGLVTRLGGAWCCSRRPAARRRRDGETATGAAAAARWWGVPRELVGAPVILPDHIGWPIATPQRAADEKMCRRPRPPSPASLRVPPKVNSPQSRHLNAAHAVHMSRKLLCTPPCLVRYSATSLSSAHTHRRLASVCADFFGLVGRDAPV